MATFKVTSITSSYDGEKSLVVITAPGHNFEPGNFVTINNCIVPELNGTFRVIVKDGDLLNFLIPLLVANVSTVEGTSVSSIAELTISPRIFSDVETNMTYLYGVSDFWSTMFEGREKIDLLLEAETQQSSEIYSKFLQLTSTLSISEIQTTLKSQLKLVILSLDNLVPGTANTYYLPEVITKASFIMNRPFLPTLTLEEGTHFSINEEGTELSLFERLESLNFPIRKNSSGENEFALWFTDVEVDEGLINKYFGRLIGVTPQQSTDKFKNFVYGLFYLYSRGPNLALFRKGLNLALGLPLARDYETVLSIRQYLETNQYLVITDLNQYLIPYGLAPTVAEGDFLFPSQELAQWVEIKDWVNDGKWWLNLHIPKSVMPYIPEGEPDRYATEGSYADQVMEGFLRNHTFLVNVNVVDFKDIQTFQELYDIIYRVKPAYTTPIYIWSVPIDEPIPIIEELDELTITPEWCENLSAPVTRMIRNNSDSSQYLYRGCAQFIRFNVSSYVAEIAGGSALINGLPRELSGGEVTGYVNYRAQYEDSGQSDADKAWIRVLFNRNDLVQRWKKSVVKFKTDPVYTDNSGLGVSSFPINVQTGNRVIPLYVISTVDLQEKTRALGLGDVSTNKWVIEFFKPTNTGAYINQVPINAERLVDYSSAVKANLSTLFTRTETGKVGNFMPRHINDYTYTGVTVDDIQVYDYVVAIKIYDYTWGMYWVTSNQTINALPFIEIHDFDSLSIEISGSKISRGMGPLGNPYYLLRGAGVTTTDGTNVGINQGAINTNIVGENSSEVEFEDTINTIQVMDRSGRLINIRKDLL